MKSFAKTLSFICIITQCLTGCAGRHAHPIAIHQPDDFKKSCTFLISELDELQSNINRLLPKENKTGKNVALGVAGAIFLVPWFFMDFSDAEKVEIEAYRNRYNHLSRIYNEKHCGTERALIPEFQMKKAKK